MPLPERVRNQTPRGIGQLPEQTLRNTSHISDDKNSGYFPRGASKSGPGDRDFVGGSSPAGYRQQESKRQRARRRALEGRRARNVCIRNYDLPEQSGTAERQQALLDVVQHCVDFVAEYGG